MTAQAVLVRNDTTKMTCRETKERFRFPRRLSIRDVLLFQVAIGAAFLIYIYAQWQAITLAVLLGAFLAQFDIQQVIKSMTENQFSPFAAGTIFRAYATLVMMSGLCLVLLVPALVIRMTLGIDAAYLVLKTACVAGVVAGIYSPLWSVTARKMGLRYVFFVLRLVS